MNYFYFIIPAIIVLLILIPIIILHFKRKSVIRKVNSLSLQEKNKLLDTLAEPGGFNYEARQDIFSTTPYAPQKLFGYTTFYDLSAPFFNMVFDYETIYFNYNSRTWLIEMWKGQYGINAGCELGIYAADGIVSPDKYNTTHFTAADTADWLDIALELYQLSGNQRSSCTSLGHMQSRHWWLTIFNLGTFARPQDLFVNTAIRFKSCGMMRSFLNSFENTLPDTAYRVNGLTVCFSFDRSHRRYSFFKRLVRSIALASCRIYCKWFNYVTRPFTESGDKLLYLYYYLPFTIRSIFRPRKNRR